ncbi:MAG: FKBP-type peptidyl-prolyl cis-trans isomerase [Thermodesulfobacteriota bacterium]|nr:FKBP-type peptidyl-prolyl cis-trans isomerase [Thermodesulfobacteriota bacterium]
MKLSRQAILWAVLLIFATGCQNKTQQTATPEPKTDKEKVSYIIGTNMGQSIGNISEEIDIPMLQKGMSDQIEGRELLVTAEEAQPLLQAFAETIKAKQQEEMDRTKDENLKAGKAFLEENKNKEGIITTETGLQYKVLKEGDGASPTATDRVKVHYKGTTIDGTVFDSSYDRGQPAVFQADQVIRGWTEGIQLMKEGGKYKLFIPARLAYGERGAGQKIGPNETLIFEVELLEVMDNKADDKMQEEPAVE